MLRATGIAVLALLLPLGCGESAGGTGGAAGAGGAAGMGGTPSLPAGVEQTCRDWCANEPAGPSCHRRSSGSVQGCYSDCLNDYSREAAGANGNQWIYIKACQLGFECRDSCGECDGLGDDYCDDDDWCSPPDCAAAACLFCPGEALGPTIASLFRCGFHMPVDFTAVPDQPLVQGVTQSFEMNVVSRFPALPVPVTITVSNVSTAKYEVTVGGSGMIDIPIPPQTVTGIELLLDAGSGRGSFTPAADATDMVVHLTEVVLDMEITEPIVIPLLLHATRPTGSCAVYGHGVTIPVAEAGLDPSNGIQRSWP